MGRILFRNLDVILTRDNNPVSWAISVMTGDRFSHCALVGGDGSLVVTTSDHILDGKGMEVESLRKYLKGKKWAIYRRELTPFQLKEGTRLLYDLVGNPYDYVGLIKMIIHNLKGEGRAPDGTKRMKCSESVGYIYEKIGAPILEHRGWDPSMLIPSDIPMDKSFTLIATNIQGLK